MVKSYAQTICLKDDPDGTYIKKYVPEVSIAACCIHRFVSRYHFAD